MHRPAIARRLAHQRVPAAHHGRGLALRRDRQGITAHPQVAAVVLGDVEGADPGVGPPCEEAGRHVGEPLHMRVALQLHAQARQAGLEPFLGPGGAMRARAQRGGDRRQHQQQRRAAPHHPGRLLDGGVPQHAALGGAIALLALHLAQQRADALHQDPPPVALHHGHRADAVALAAHRDGFLHLAQLGLDELLDQLQTRQLRAVVLEARAQALGRGRQRDLRGVEGQQVVVQAGDQETALAGLGVLDRRAQRLDLLLHGQGARHRVGGLRLRALGAP